MPGEALFAPIFSTDELLECTGDRAWLQALLDAEAALAAAEADCGIVPRAAAEAIAERCRADGFDPAELGRAGRGGGNPVIPLVAALRETVAAEARDWVHWGATSQDVLDTAAMLVARRTLAVVDRHLDELGVACAALAQAHRATLLTARTLLQPALPTTFGAKAAGWLLGVLEARRQLEAAAEGLAAQLGGAAGTLASLGDAGPEVAERFAGLLGLAHPPAPWHTARQRVAGLGAALAVVAATAAKITGDVALLMQAEVAEASEPAAPGRGGSSALPHKRNPVAAAAAGAAARRAAALVPVLIGSVVAEHERPVGAWHAEWQPLTELLALAGGAAAHAAETVAGLEVDAAAMEANVARRAGVLLAERVGLALAAPLGRAGARAAAAAAAGSGDTSAAAAAAALAADAAVAAVADRQAIDDLLDPRGYLGAVDVWIDRALAAWSVANGAGSGGSGAAAGPGVAAAGGTGAGACGGTGAQSTEGR